MDAALYVIRVLFAAFCLTVFVLRCISGSLNALGVPMKMQPSSTNPLVTIAFAYLFIATLLTLINR